MAEMVGGPESGYQKHKRLEMMMVRRLQGSVRGLKLETLNERVVVQRSRRPKGFTP